MKAKIVKVSDYNFTVIIYLDDEGKHIERTEHNLESRADAEAFAYNYIKDTERIIEFEKKFGLNC